MLKAYGGKRKGRYYQVNNDALQAFQRRRDSGMNLSQKLWNQSEDYKRGLEHTLSVAIEKGMSAVTLSKRVSKYLEDFPSLKKDYGERFGRATDIHDCEYRSIRLARSEINMAYRSAEQMRWEQMDFIIGYEVKLSGNHNCKGVPQGAFYDICDDLKGRYPKDFKWLGWHPNCRCYVVPIIKSEERFWEDEDKRGDDNEEITELPDNFKQWAAQNKDRIDKAEQRGTLPYFIRDNTQYTGITPRIAGTNGFTGTKLGRAATKEAYKEYSDSKPIVLTAEQTADIKALGQRFEKEVSPMTFTEADSGSVNEHYSSNPHSPYFQNCQTCVAVFEARLRGLDIVAKGYSADNLSQIALGDNTALAFLTAKGKTPTITVLKGETDDLIFSKLEKQTKAVGRYHIGVNYKQMNYGHIFTAERLPNGKILYYDAQKNEFLNIRELANIESFEVLKVDKLLLNHDVIWAIAD